MAGGCRRWSWTGETPQAPLIPLHSLHSGAQEPASPHLLLTAGVLTTSYSTGIFHSRQRHQSKNGQKIGECVSFPISQVLRCSPGQILCFRAQLDLVGHGWEEGRGGRCGHQPSDIVIYSVFTPGPELLSSSLCPGSQGPAC